jgi:hypothetical protein
VVERFLGICFALSFEEIWKSKLILVLIGISWLLAALEICEFLWLFF